jgi:hypothetical protein
VPGLEWLQLTDLQVPVHLLAGLSTSQLMQPQSAQSGVHPLLKLCLLIHLHAAVDDKCYSFELLALHENHFGKLKRL